MCVGCESFQDWLCFVEVTQVAVNLDAYQTLFWSQTVCPNLEMLMHFNLGTGTTASIAASPWVQVFAEGLQFWQFSIAPGTS